MAKPSKMLERTLDLATDEPFQAPLGKSFASIFYNPGEGKYACVIKRGHARYIGCLINQQSEIPIRDLQERGMPHMADADLADYAHANDWEMRKGGVELYRSFHAAEENEEEAVEVAEGEMVPAENQKPTAGGISGIPLIEIHQDNGVNYLRQRSVDWHEAAQQHAKMAVICAARAGAELNRLKGQCKQGEWKNIVKGLPFGAETARKYRILADQMQERLLDGDNTINLLELPDPSDLSAPEYAETLGQFNAVTGEQTLRQLYFDWGIVKQTKKGGDHGGGQANANRTEEEIEQGIVDAVRKNWKERAALLSSDGLNDMSWARLQESEIKGLQALCQALADKMLRHINHKSEI